MSQQINLFNESLLEKRSLYSASSMGGMILISGLLIVLLFSVLQWRLSQVIALESQSAQRLTALDLELKNARASHAVPAHDPKLAQELTTLQDELKQTRRALDILGSNELGNTQGFSEYMLAFARQIPERVWLTGFDYEAEISRLSIHGRALQADLVPQFVNQLKREKIMKGKAFAALDLERPQLENGSSAQDRQKAVLAPYVEFEFHTTEPSDKKDGGVKQP